MTSETSVRVHTAFYVECPHCGQPCKYEVMMDDEGETLRNRFREIIQGKGGVTAVPVKCQNSKCNKSFTITSFKI